MREIDLTFLRSLALNAGGFVINPVFYLGPSVNPYGSGYVWIRKISAPEFIPVRLGSLARVRLLFWPYNIRRNFVLCVDLRSEIKVSESDQDEEVWFVSRVACYQELVGQKAFCFELRFDSSGKITTQKVERFFTDWARGLQPKD